MGYIEDLKKMYEDTFKSKEQDLIRDKTNKTNALNQQKQEATDRYNTNLSNQNTMKTETQNKYNQMYTGLDNQKTDAESKYYNDKNQVALGNAKQTQQIRDYMANANLLQSGESVDALLRNSTNFGNNMNNVYNNEQSTYRGIDDKRNQYKSDENRAYQEIDNQIKSLTSERDRIYNNIQNGITGLEDEYASRSKSLKDELSANYMKDYTNYQERLRQEELQRQREAEQRAYEEQQRQIEYQRQQQLAAQKSSSSASSGSNSKAQQGKDLYDEFMGMVRSQDNWKARDFLENNKSDIVMKYGSSYYKNLENAYWDDMQRYYS